MLNMAFRTVIFTLIALFPVSSFCTEEKELKIAYPDFYPFFSETRQGRLTGFFYEIVTEAIQQRMGIPVEWTQMPWKRCQFQVQAGTYDAMITVPTEERLVYSVTHPTPFYKKEIRLFTYSGHKRLAEIEAIRTIADIQQGGFSVITYSGNSWNANNIERIGIPTIDTSEVHNVWKMLAAERGDLVIEWPVGARAGIEQAGAAAGIIETDVALEAMPFHLLIGKKSEYRDIIDEFNIVIEKMLEDGSITDIVSKYE